MSPEFYARIDARHRAQMQRAHKHLGREECWCDCTTFDGATCTCDTCDEETCWCHETEVKPVAPEAKP